MIAVVSHMDTLVGGFFTDIRSEKLTTFFKAITLLGNWQVVVGIAIIVTIVWWRKKRLSTLTLWLSLFLNEGLVYFGKNVIARLRPLGGLISENDYSFPSGHAAIAVVLYGFLAYVLITTTKKKWLQYVIAFLAVALIVLIAISRLYLGVHYFSDIIGGFVVGGISLFVAIKLLSSKE